MSRLDIAQRISQLLIILIEMSCGDSSPVQSSAVISCLQRQMKKNGFNLKARCFQESRKKAGVWSTSTPFTGRGLGG